MNKIRYNYRREDLPVVVSYACSHALNDELANQNQVRSILHRKS